MKKNYQVQALQELCRMIDLPEEVTERLLALERSGEASCVSEHAGDPADDRLAVTEAEGKTDEVMSSLYRDLTNPERWQDARKVLKEKNGADEDGMKMLLCMMHAMQHSHELYIDENISDQIFADTMKCFSRFVREHMASFGTYGFDRDFWTGRQLSLLLFRLGELEFEMISPADGEAESESSKKRTLSVHIPSDANLSPECCDASFRMAESFFREHFPEAAEDCFSCDSWLLSPALKELLPPESRIMKFQSRFEVKHWNQEADACLEWVFKRKDLPLRDLPEETSLQRKMKAYLLAGGKVGEAYGELRK